MCAWKPGAYLLNSAEETEVAIRDGIANVLALALAPSVAVTHGNLALMNMVESAS